MTERHFLWPKPRLLRAVVSIARFESIGAVEGRLEEIFPGGYPVLCSSGRSAIVLALTVSGLSRSDTVQMFPYASHCVLDAVSRVATPTLLEAGNVGSVRLICNQWGYVNDGEAGPSDIEDCVDTLLRPGAVLFPRQGAFEIWSFPKILGTTGGGVLWCRDAEVAELIRELRNGRGGGALQWTVRLLGARSRLAHSWWQGGEGVTGLPSRLQTGEIMAALDDLPTLVAKRQAALDMIWPYTVGWLDKPTDRLPCVVPVELPDDADVFCEQFGLLAGKRMFQRHDKDGSRTLECVLPVPVHQDVTSGWLERIAAELENGHRGNHRA